MTPPIPPSEAQLKEKLDWISKPGGSLHADEVRWLIAEIRRLRELCGRAATRLEGCLPFRKEDRMPGHAELIRELRAASEGRK